MALDGTGGRMIPRETAGRRGQGADGKAHRREVKLGCLFTQTTRFRKAGIFVGSGAVEAGCKAVSPSG